MLTELLKTSQEVHGFSRVTDQVKNNDGLVCYLLQLRIHCHSQVYYSPTFISCSFAEGLV